MTGPVSMSAPGGNGGGFTFQADQIDAVIKKWQDLLDDLKTDAEDARNMAAVKAPGKEFASGDFAKLAIPSVKAFIDQNTKMQEYVENYVEALESAKKSMTNNEADTEAALKKTGEQA
ncbi:MULTISPECIES: hypothetical protein [Amycolatopsis]|uniref:PE domain-containing protein n=1 Tax=Amycolatopsis albispora TaxID=1804986 RepID=A0A344LE23_9PSEU|nr:MULTISPECIES: hypothetical protein [Amycolatopsis]AXB46297.1 hypothetical protein A4R43_30750 [Amycolatopsis albispora]QFU94712.1 hypothetical protein YIM_47935 [Amycolatopsis sp. YIM 10]